MPRGIRTALVAVVLLAGVALPARAGVMQPARAGLLENLPNLAPQPPSSIHVALAETGTGLLALRFSTTTANVGAYALELLGGAPSADLARADALQCVTFATRACLVHERVGDFVWHPAHGHWHLDRYARYELRHLDGAGQPIPGPAGLAAGGQKVSFCLIDVARSGPPRPIYDNPPLYLGCTGVIQGISAGWADTYEHVLAGQQVVIDGVSDGDYALMITVDPDGLLRQTTRDDDTSFRRIKITDGGTSVIVLP